jgi:hypothetical protein
MFWNNRIRFAALSVFVALAVMGAFVSTQASFVQRCYNLDCEDHGLMTLVQIHDSNAKQVPHAVEALMDAKGKSRRLDEYHGRPLVLVFSRGAGLLSLHVPAEGL